MRETCLYGSVPGRESVLKPKFVNDETAVKAVLLASCGDINLKNALTHP